MKKIDIMNIDEISKRIAKAITNQIQRVESLIGSQKWEILNAGGDELFGVSTPYLSEQQVERLEQSAVDGLFDQNTFFNGDGFYLDAYAEVHYWIGVYSDHDSSLEDHGDELKQSVSTILGYPIIAPNNYKVELRLI